MNAEMSTIKPRCNSTVPEAIGLNIETIVIRKVAGKVSEQNPALIASSKIVL